jgi:Rrf2 family iron-sulfur cluster assembly transcriptional regulator
MDEISIKNVLDCVGENINPAKDILGTEAESSNTVEFHLSKGYFQNLGIIMQEYLETTSLGDLSRKAQDIKIEEREEETKSPFESAVNDIATRSSERSVFGDFN